jgi:S1-C subfamily serine protease
VRRGYLGISANPVRLPEGLGQGVGLMLLAVEPLSPAAEAGLALGDVILTLDGGPVRHMEGLAARLSGDRVGQPLAIGLLRGGERREVTATVGEWPAEG